MMSDIHHLAMHGKDKELLELLNRSIDEIDSTSTAMGETPLIFASRGGHLSTVKLLLEKGADSTLVVSDGHTALHAVIGELKGGQQPIENFYALAKELLQYKKGEGLKLLNLPVSTTDDRTLFRSLNRYQEVKTRILQIVEGIDPNNPLLLSADTSPKPQTATAPIKEETPPVTSEPPPQSKLRHRHIKPVEQPQPREMTVKSSKSPYLASKPITPSGSIFFSVQTFFGSIFGYANKGYQKLPISTPDEPQRNAITPTKD